MTTRSLTPEPRREDAADLNTRRTTYERALTILTGHIDDSTAALASLAALRKAAETLPANLAGKQTSLGKTKLLHERSRVNCIKSHVLFLTDTAVLGQQLRLEEARASAEIAKHRLKVIAEQIQETEREHQ